uniref:Uncharacterized protein n=1 Tax=Neogobius melanostomus TaxID=47308 RepID=A0A8C6TXA7_9GOBI
DTINGRIILEVSKETKVQALTFRAQGQARVCWNEQYGQYAHMVYTSNEKYDVSHHILRKTRNDGTEVIGPGRHVFPFSFKIPDGKMPSTFQSSVGKIVHKLKGELKQSMQLTKTAKTHFTFVSSADMDIPGLLEPQSGCKDKTIMCIGASDSVGVTVSCNGGFLARDTGGDERPPNHPINTYQNQSSRAVKPKFVLYRKKSYFAQGKRRMNTKDVLKEKCDVVESGCNKTVTKTITVPKELPPSILNCSIIKLDLISFPFTYSSTFKLPPKPCRIIKQTVFFSCSPHVLYKCVAQTQCPPRIVRAVHWRRASLRAYQHAI